MTEDQFQILTKLNNYLNNKKAAGIQAFQKLPEIIKKEAFKIVGISFTYENIEVLGKKDTNFEMVEVFFGILSESEIDEITHYEFDENDAKEDHLYYHGILDMSQKMIELWIVDCFHESKIGEEIDIPIYWKASFDSMEILELRTLETFYEKVEFETHKNLIGKRTMELFPIY